MAKNAKTLLRTALVAMCLMCLYACGTSKKAVEKNSVIRWPNHLREWASDYGINDSKRMDIIDQIDMLYKMVEDSTGNKMLLCESLCRMQNTVSDAIVHDSSIVFALMMRATARNISGKIYNNPWLLKLGCDCSITDYLIDDAMWYTFHGEETDLMYTTVLGLSWQAQDRFANLMLFKEDDSELSTASLLVYNLSDYVIDNLQITFTDSTGTVIEQLTEEDTYVDVPDVGVKRMTMPSYLVMKALVAGGTLTVSYNTPQDTIEMVGYPHIYFMKQIEDCPRLKQIINQALSDN